MGIRPVSNDVMKRARERRPICFRLTRVIVKVLIKLILIGFLTLLLCGSLSDTTSIYIYTLKIP